MPILPLLLPSLALFAASPARAAPRDLDDVPLAEEVHPDLLLAVGEPRARTAPASRASSWLGIHALYSYRDGRSAYAGTVVLGLALDRIAQGRPPEPLRAEPPRAPPVAPPAPPPPAPRLALSPALARACVAAAWRATGLGTDDGPLDAMAARARWSALLPETRLRAMRLVDARAQVDTASDQARTVDANGANLWLEARLMWRLDRLLYADDETTFERLRRERQEARARVAGKALDALFLWQRARLDRGAAPPDTREHLEAELRVVEAASTLDVLTGGWFSAQRLAP